MAQILIIGATGNIGYYVVEHLVKRHIKIKVAVSTLEKGEMFSSGEVVHFDFLNKETYGEALEGVKKIFLVRPPQLANPKEDMLPFLQAAKKNGVEHIVFVSLVGVEKNPVVPHHKIEKFIVDLGFTYTFLRPSFFMQNLNTTHREEIVQHDELFIPVGKAKTSFIDTRDIGEIAALCLVEDGHENKCYTLTGGEAIDYYEVASTMSEVLQREITYKNPGLLAFRSRTIKNGVPKEFANVMTILYLMTKLGTAKSVTNDVEKLLHRKPTSFKQYVEDYHFDFQ